jgi:hypothetical protein
MGMVDFPFSDPITIAFLDFMVGLSTPCGCGPALHAVQKLLHPSDNTNTDDLPIAASYQASRLSLATLKQSPNDISSPILHGHNFPPSHVISFSLFPPQ